MGNIHNETASSSAAGPVRVGVIADGELPPELSGALEECLLLQPVAQSGMPAVCRLSNVPHVEDARVLLQRPELEAVLLLASTRANDELAGLALDRGLHLWQMPPIALTFAQAVEAVRRARRSSCVYRLASWWEFVAEHVWHELPWPGDFKPRFSELRVCGAPPPRTSWRRRAAECAGGPLANDGYGLLEGLVALRGLPESVTAATTIFLTDHEPDGRPTEDAVAAILKYRQGGSAIVRAGWDGGPAPSGPAVAGGHEATTRRADPTGARMLAHIAPSASVSITEELLCLRDPAATLLEQRPIPGDFVASELARFAECVRSHARERAALPLERHLAVTALLEAVYLSSRTEHPESPAKFYQLQRWPLPLS